MAVPAEQVVARLVADVTRELGDAQVCVAAFGSWVSGDFCPGRSDVDLLVAMRRPPAEDDLARLLVVHDRVEADLAEWAGHVEVEYVAVSSVQGVTAGLSSDDRMLRISPGEALHLIPVTRHAVLDWDAARRADRTLAGAPAASVLPVFPQALVDEVLRDHLRQWPQWVTEEPYVGSRAYAVLTVARCAVRLRTRQPLSKREAARTMTGWATERAPPLGWAEGWWYAGGSDAEAAPPDVVDFVRAISGAALSR